MFNEDELTVYDKTFQTIGVLDKEEKKRYWNSSIH